MNLLQQNLIHPPQYHKLLLKDFWDTFGSNRNNGIGYDESFKMEYVIALANIKIKYKAQKTLKNRRNNFNKNFNKKPVKRPPCFICNVKSQCRHHMIQLQNGGINCKRNIINLCNKCHATIHPWLRK